MSQSAALATSAAVERANAPSDTARRHLHQVDLLRLLTFGCVIAVHVVSATTDGASVVANGLLMLLHFTRETFFALTGFVLMYSYGRARLRVRRFWKRRYLLVGVPYVVWSVIYFAVGLIGQPAQSWSTMITGFASALAQGGAWYHLYFLLVSLQVYLLFPVLLWLLRRTQGRHWLLLGVSAVIELAVNWVETYGPPTSGVLGSLTSRLPILFVSYQFYVVLGALAALHFDQMHKWVCQHLRLIGVGVVVIGALTVGWYLLVEQSDNQPWIAAAPLQPAMMPWSVAITAGLYALGVRWIRSRRETSLFSRTVTAGSQRSFGVFLSHPLVLWVVLTAGAGWLPSHLGTPWLSVVAYVLAVAGAAAVTELCYRSALSLPLIGRQRQAKKHHSRSQSATRAAALSLSGKAAGD